jgi:uncharacterized membrane protein YfcA
MIALTVALAVLVGVSLGLLGGGGSILMVPLLAYVADVDAEQAIATSLLVVGVTGAIGAVSHAREGRVNWRTGLTFGSAGMLGAYAGGLVSAFVPGSLLLVGFAAVMITAAIAMLRGRRENNDAAPAASRPKILAEGLGVGFITGLVGAGGGFMVVPALALLAGLPMATAVGTSLVVIAMNSFAGVAGHLTGGQINWSLAAMVTAAAVVGTLLGARVTGLVKPDTLRIAFGWFVMAMASVILAQEIHPAVGLATAGVTFVAGTMYLSCRLGIFCPLRALYPGG